MLLLLCCVFYSLSKLYSHGAGYRLPMLGFHDATYATAVDPTPTFDDGSMVCFIWAFMGYFVPLVVVAEPVIVNFKAPKEMVGKLVDVKIDEAKQYSLNGTFIGEHQRELVMQ